MYSGGGERTAIYEALLLRKRGHTVTCFAPAIRTDLCFPELITEIEPKGILPRVKVRIPFRDFASLTATSIFAPLFAAKFQEFDVILSHGQPATWVSYLISRLDSKPRVTYLHQPARFLYPRAIDLQVGWKTKLDFALLKDIVETLRPLGKSLDHVSVVASERVITNSRWIRAQIRNIYGVEPIVCPPGADTDKFVPLRNKASLVVKGQEVAKPFILSTNRHYPQKGLSELLRIYAQLRREVKCHLVLTGDFTNYTAILRKQCEELGVSDGVLFTGRVSELDLVRLYQNADVYAFTSPEEDFGLGPVEAMAAGTPPVVWNNAGPSETVLDGVTGLKAKPNDLDEFASKLKRILQDDSFNVELSRNAAEHARRNYSWSNHIELLEDVLAEVAERS